MKKLHVYKYQGAGNDFVIIDDRDDTAHLTSQQIKQLCDRRFGVGADGLMTLSGSTAADFGMHYYNADGPEGTMCGNGGRCLVAFAAHIGLKSFDFTACDGRHRAEVLEFSPDRCTVRLGMRDVAQLQWLHDGCLLDTGSPHFVQWVKDLRSFDVEGEGKRLRWDSRFPAGVNVNFVEAGESFLSVRTYERGVEAETWACGTGSVASALASFVRGEKCFVRMEENGAERIKFAVNTLGGELAVDFIAESGGRFRDIWLTGPAVKVFETDIDLDKLC